MDIRRFALNTVVWRNLIFYAGAILPFGITCFLLWRAGVFNQFWFWTIDYAYQYGSLVPLSQASQVFFPNVREVIGAGWALWAFAGIGLVAGLWDERTRSGTRFLFGLLAFSVLALSPGFYFRFHYFILVLPAVSLLVGVAISKLSDLAGSDTSVTRFIPLLLLGAALSLPIFWEKKFFFGVSPFEACRMIYPESPFPESIKIAEYVRDHTSLTETIAVLGSEPQIYFYSHRHSATGYIYTYGLMERQKYAHQMQQEMIREIELAHPKYLISVVIEDSWLQQAGSDRRIFAWANEYTGGYYDVVGFVNIITSDGSDFYLGAVPKSVPQLGNYILIYERKS